MDIFDKIKTSKGGPLGQYKSIAHGYFAFPKLEGEIGPRMKFRGKEVLNWSLNNYLGLANHPEVRKVDTEATEKYGLAYPMGARMMSGQTTFHEELEQQLAQFVKKEDAFLCNYGYQAMISILDSLLNRNDVVVYDSESHACIIDGLRLHMGKRLVYPHNNIERLEHQLKRAKQITQHTGGGILVVTEGVYGMAGDLGKLKDIVELKKKYNFRLLIDDAHGFGTMGPNGAGTDEHFGVSEEVDIYFATFAKAMAGIGAFVASTQEVVDYLRYNMRSQIFAKSLPLPMVIGAMKRLELLKTQPQLRQKLWTIVKALQNGLKEKGLDIGKTESPVTPVYLKGTPIEAGNVVFELREKYNIFCSIVIYPVVPKDVIMLRLIPTAVHTLEDVQYTINAFEEINNNLKAGRYSKESIPFFSIPT
ncbi:MAG: pyridoxal phosphate-dependent aminotransferase family protein [Bacteroidales bacterium]|nr:pyridoxal phosphate-dependent aminotransferase family protein [Bacteroidales bacterium]